MLKKLIQINRATLSKINNNLIPNNNNNAPNHNINNLIKIFQIFSKVMFLKL